MASAESFVGDVGLAPALTIKWLDHLETFQPGRAPITVGRAENLSAQIRIPDNRISREHITVTVRDGQWIARAVGRNGVFLGNDRVESEFAVPPDSEVDVMLGHPVAGIPMSFSTRDPVNVHVGEQIARRRKELGISQRTLADEGVVNAGALIGIEKGRSQPRAKTEDSLEKALQWPKGTIEQLRRQIRAGVARPSLAEIRATPVAPIGTVDSDGPTELLRYDGDGEITSTVEVTLVTETIGIALSATRSQIAALPDPAQPEYPARVAAVTSDLARLEQLAVNASRSSIEMVRELGEIRRLRRELTLAAAASPYATLGQRLFAARRNAELSIDEAAPMAGVSAEDIRQIEAGAEPGGGVEIQLQRFIAALGSDSGSRTAG
ncbi:helix-turn-helix domain-containing protein [Mycolicibacterium houstonense]|uniref:helix-turn-helix domain-containing protein n=1 Tax=Mycolicibacterium houstonense TaxID=146021 RepID=UPI0009FF5180|nr:helix-turn-helix domain-containing protein [Mycolicibacterium houstonense]